MKKFLWWIPVLLIFFGLGFYQPLKLSITGKPGHHKIAITVFKATPYASSVYSSTSAELRVTVEQVSGSKRVAVWNKTFGARLLRQYPSAAHALFDTVVVPTANGREELTVTYTITYNSGGTELQRQNAAVFSGNNGTSRITISI